MKKRQLFSMLCLTAISALLAPLAGQEVGADMESVRAAAGEPSMIRKSGAREIWMYNDGRKVVFENGAVLTVDGRGAAGIAVSGAAAGEPAVAESAAPETEAAVARSPAPREASESHVTVVSAPKTAGAATTPSEEKDMPILQAVVVLIALLVCVVGNIWFLVQAFREGFLWGMGCLVVPFVPLIFAAKHWSKVKVPFALSVASAVLILGVSATV